MKGYITSHDEWLYPDTKLTEVDPSINISMASNGEEGVKLLYKATESLVANMDQILIKVRETSGLKVGLYEMIDVFVGYNETEKMVQDGQFVILEEVYEKPDFCTRKAPFRVYEALNPVEKLVRINHGHFPMYITVGAHGENTSSKVEGKVVLIDICHPVSEEVLQTITIKADIYPVAIPRQTLNITNWFSIENMATYHNIEENTQEHYDMIRQYAKMMRRLRQTHFFIEYDKKEQVYKDGEYNFEGFKPIIDIFFEEGFETMEFGYFATKAPTSFTSDLKCAFDTDIRVCSDKGYFELQRFTLALKRFLVANKWDHKTILHICDEPDVHVDNYGALEKRKQDYFKIANIIKKHLPLSKTVEAVKTTEFKSAVDIWVPLTANYEEFQAHYDLMAEYGDQVWCYVCCVPTGHHLNRFLDIDLIKSRLIFWGISKYNLTGYLHWGLNRPPSTDFNPFENSNTPNIEFNGLYPSGDAFIVYPGEDKPLMGMRFEAQRKGAEDYELLRLLKSKDEEAYNTIMENVVTSFSQYNPSVENFEAMRVKILNKLL